MEVLIVFWLVFAAVGYWISGQKNCEGSEGCLLGLLLGPIGLLIEAVLPTIPRQAAPGNQPSTPFLTTEEMKAVIKVREVAEAKAEELRKRTAALQREEEQRIAQEHAAERKLQEQERAAEELRQRIERDQKERLRQEKREELWRKLQARREQLEALPEELWRKLQARREQLEALPEGIKIVVGVAIGIVAIAALFAIIVMLAPK